MTPEQKEVLYKQVRLMWKVLTLADKFEADEVQLLNANRDFWAAMTGDPQDFANVKCLTDLYKAEGPDA